HLVRALERLPYVCLRPHGIVSASSNIKPLLRPPLPRPGGRLHPEDWQVRSEGGNSAQQRSDRRSRLLFSERWPALSVVHDYARTSRSASIASSIVERS